MFFSKKVHFPAKIDILTYEHDIIKIFTHNIFDSKSYGTVSQVQIIDETPALFPTVTLCDSNPFTTTYSYGILNILLQQLTLQSINQSIPLPSLGFYEYYVNLQTQFSFYLYSFATAYMMAPSFSYTSRKALGWDLSQYLTECTFNGVKCDFNNDFQWYFSPQYGNCYHFNPPPTGNLVRKLHFLLLLCD